MNKTFPLSIPALIAVLLASPLLGQDHVATQSDARHFSSTDHANLRDYLHESVEEGDVPAGVVILIQRGETIFRESFGYRDLKRQLPFELTTPFHAASLSKSIVSTLVIKLHADGVLDLDEAINVKLPAASRLQVKDSKPLDRMPTIRECLHHTAGFTPDESKGGRPWLGFRGKGMTLAEAVDAELQLPMARQPGERFAYSGIGYDIVGRIIEVATGQPIDEVLQTRLCQPLGMHHTTFHPDEAARRELARFYWRWRSDGSFHRQLDRRIVRSGEYASVGGGIVTTADDLARFMLMHRNAGLVDGKPWVDEELLKRQYVRKRPGAYYGLGFTLGTGDDQDIASWILHTGSSGTMFWWDRQTDTVGVIVTQHRYSNGETMPDSDKRIPRDADSWPEAMKKEMIDPVFGWRPLKKTMKP